MNDYNHIISLILNYPMSSIENQSDRASFSINFSLPRETIREYFDGLAKVEAVKHTNSFSSTMLNGAMACLNTAIVDYFTNIKAKSMDVPNPADYFGDYFDDDSEIDSVDETDNTTSTIEHLVPPVSSTNTECEVDITKVTHGTQVRTVINLLSCLGLTGDAPGDEEVLDHAISVLQFMRKNPENKLFKSDKNKSKTKANKQQSCINDICSTASCEIVNNVKTDKSDNPVSVASSTEDEFQPNLTNDIKKRKVIVKPKYEPEGSTITNITKFALPILGMDKDSEQSKMFQQYASTLFAGLKNGGDLESFFSTKLVKEIINLVEKKDEIKEVTKDGVKEDTIKEETKEETKEEKKQ